jgi:dTDP-4-dehydrorhamnose reductase
LKEIKFLVTGSAGFVGRQVAKDLLESGTKLYCSYHNSRPEFGIKSKMDLTQDDDIISTIQKIKPDVIIHAAAMADVDLCEKEQEMATRINAQATSTISEQAAKAGSFLVYVSTDYVFDGKKGMRVESDTPSPINHYGKTKMEGENAVQDKARKWCIARTSIPYGIHPTQKRFLTLVAQSLKEKKSLACLQTSTSVQHTCQTYQDDNRDCNKADCRYHSCLRSNKALKI